MFFLVISWMGVAMLMAAHLSISTGVLKETASRISFSGGMISAVAAFGMGIWPVFVLNIIWAGISIWGSKVIEDRALSVELELAIIIASLMVIPAWMIGAEPVSWVGSAVYISGWMLYSAGKIRRVIYLGACAIAGVLVSPALWSLGAQAFAFNEFVGTIISLKGMAAFAKSADHSSSDQRPQGQAA